MNFKKANSPFLLILASAFALTSCGLKINEKPASPMEAEFVAGNKVKCISRTMPYFKSFFSGEQGGEKIGEFWDCAQAAMDVFAKYSEGEEEDRYTVKALGRFLERYFIEDAILSEELLRQGMLIKQLFLGGSISHFDKAEIDQAIRVLAAFKAITIEAFPYMKIYNGSWQEGEDVKINFTEEEIEFFEKANLQLQDSVKALADLIRADSPVYKIDNFLVFVREMAALSGGQESFVSDLAQLIPLIKKTKLALAGGDENLIAEAEWRKFLLIGARGYFQYLRFKTFIQNPEVSASKQVFYMALTAEDVLSLLGDLVNEKASRSLSKEELYSILKQLSAIYPEFKISEPLLDEFMVIKRLIFGGTEVVFTPEEFSQGKTKVLAYRNLVMRLLPYLEVYDKSWNPALESLPEAREYFLASGDALSRSLQDLSQLLIGDYELTSLKRLTAEIEALYQSERSREWAHGVRVYYPLIKSFKSLITSKESEKIEQADWRIGLKYLARFFMFYREHGYFLSASMESQDPSMTSWSLFLQRGLSEIKGLMREKPKSSISWQEWDDLVGALEKSQLLGSSLTSGALKKGARILVQRTLAPLSMRLSGVVSSAIKPVHVDVALSELDFFFSAFETLAEIVEKNGGSIASEQLVKEMRQRFDKTKENRGVNNPHFSELLMLLASPRIGLVATDGSKKWIIQDHLRFNTRYNLASLQHLHLLRFVVRALFLGYSNSYKAVQDYVGLSADEFSTLIKEIVPILVDIKWLAEYKATYASARFLEANLFMPRSDGDDYFDFAEGVEYLLAIWTGVEVQEKIKQSLVQAQCVPNPGTLENPKVLVPLNCYREAFASSFAPFYQHLSGLMGFVANFNKAELMSFIELLERSSAFDYFGKTGGLLVGDLHRGLAVNLQPNREDILFVKLSDISLHSNILQYIESTLIRYDDNGDNELNTKEALRAFPIFKGTLSQITGVDSETALEAIFTYMLHFGKAPEKSISGYWSLYKWWRSKDQWNLKVKRRGLAEILAALQEQNKTMMLYPPEFNDIK